MSRLHSRSNTRLITIVCGSLLAAQLAGCGDDDCGPAGAPSSGLVATSDQATLTFGGLAAGLNTARRATRRRA
jgi:hypothetical protein